MLVLFRAVGGSLGVTCMLEWLLIGVLYRDSVRG